ncbi:MAG TPA: hypothetical protein GXX40_00645 [Firmicutes bacterium]|nr:hypothetical protein [Bacillota bacterium]
MNEHFFRVVTPAQLLLLAASSLYIWFRWCGKKDKSFALRDYTVARLFAFINMVLAAAGIILLLYWK